MSACQTCGTPVSYHPAQQGSPAYDPTIVASPYGTPQNAQTAYGANPYGASPSSGTQYNPYGASPSSETQYNPYGNIPSAQSPYGGVGYNQPVQPPPNYGYPQGQPQGGYIPGGVPGVPGSYSAMPTQPPKKRSRVGLIIGIVVGGVLLLCVGLGILGAVIGSRQAGKTTASGATGTNQTDIPSGKSVVSSAAAILHNPQTSSDIDKDYNPTHITSTFTTSQSVYVTFDIDSGNNDGYIEAKWYADGQIISTKSLPHTHTNGAGIFSRSFTTPTTHGAAELYWCTQADCSDAQLAQVVHFTVNATGLAPTSPTLATLQDAYRRGL